MIAAIRVTLLMLVLTVLFGLGYPLAITGLTQILMPTQANGSLVTADNKIIGSSLIGQSFASDRYFWSRPSAAGSNGYDAGNSSGSNLAVTNKDLLKAFDDRITASKKANGKANIPADLVTASASGLDPDITPEAAQYQAARIAQTRHLSLDSVQTLIQSQTTGRIFGLLGMPRVNVLALNQALDKMETQKTK